MQFTTLRFESVDSTNTVAAELARHGADEGLCVVAEEQTAGRGRHGRRWISERHGGLYISIVLRPSLRTEQMPLITLMAGVAVCDTLREVGLEPDIKWVNDIICGERKICGILADAIETARGTAVILGIGINLTDGNVAGKLDAAATSVEAELHRRILGANLESLLTRYMDVWYTVLNGHDGAPAIISAWSERSSYYIGKHVRATMHERVIEGITAGLDTNGALRVHMSDGSVIKVQAGNVERLRSVEPGID